MKLTKKQEKRILKNAGDQEIISEILIHAMNPDELTLFRSICEEHMRRQEGISMLLVYKLFTAYEKDKDLNRLPSEWKADLIWQEFFPDND